MTFRLWRCFFLLFSSFYSFSPRPDQEVEEPPSKRLTEPADVLRMPVSNNVCPFFLSLFSTPLLPFCLSYFSYQIFAGIGRALLPPACPKARIRGGPFPTKKRLTPPASKAHTTRLPFPSFSRSCLTFIHPGVTPNIVLFKIMQSHV